MKKIMFAVAVRFSGSHMNLQLECLFEFENPLLAAQFSSDETNVSEFNDRWKCVNLTSTSCQPIKTSSYRTFRAKQYAFSNMISALRVMLQQFFREIENLVFHHKSIIFSVLIKCALFSKRLIQSRALDLGMPWNQGEKKNDFIKSIIVKINLPCNRTKTKPTVETANTDKLTRRWNESKNKDHWKWLKCRRDELLSEGKN